MSQNQDPEPAVGQVRRTPPGLVALGGGAGVAFHAATFNDFIAAHVGALPEEERADALAWLAGFGSALALAPTEAEG